MRRIVLMRCSRWKFFHRTSVYAFWTMCFQMIIYVLFSESVANGAVVIFICLFIWSYHSNIVLSSDMFSWSFMDVSLGKIKVILDHFNASTTSLDSHQNRSSSVSQPLSDNSLRYFIFLWGKILLETKQKI